jgi:DNA adenine methylase
MSLNIQSDNSFAQFPPFLKWAGGKRWLVANHTSLFPTEYNRYIEPFLGSGAVLFHLFPKKAMLSDINSDLITTYIAIRDDWRGVQRELRKHQRLHSKTYYYQMRDYRPQTPVTKAAKFIYLNRTCWNGLYRVNLKGEFNVPIGTKTSVIAETDDFEGLAKFLKNKRIIVSDFETTIDKANEDDFVFVDPPYTVKHNFNGFIKYNEKLFSWEDQIRLRNAISRAVKRGAKVLISNADHECIRELYEDVGSFLSLDRASIISGENEGRGRFSELLIRCY